MKQEHGRRNDRGHIPINVNGRGEWVMSGSLLGYRFIFQYDMVYLAWFMRHDEAAGNIRLALRIGITVSFS